MLGLREILDDPETVQREWRSGEYDAAIRAYYDRIWIYGDREVYDSVTEYGMVPDIAEKVRFTGYLSPTGTGAVDVANWSDTLEPRFPDEGPVDLCVVGGGRDDVPLAEAFLQCRVPGTGVLVTGPLMPAASRARTSPTSTFASSTSVPSLDVLPYPWPPRIPPPAKTQVQALGK